MEKEQQELEGEGELQIFVVGDRVSCLWNPKHDEWYDATVIGAKNKRSGKHRVQFDIDGKKLSVQLHVPSKTKRLK